MSGEPNMRTNRPASTLVKRYNGAIQDDPEAGASTPGVPQGLALDPQQRRGLPPMVDVPADPGTPKIKVRRTFGRWLVACPCGYRWSTDYWRLAILFAVEHEHWPAGLAAHLAEAA
jgi:hypothetical protein